MRVERNYAKADPLKSSTVKAQFLLCFLFVTDLTCFAKDMTLPPAERNGGLCVAISSLVGQDEIAVKHLPGTAQWVACTHERCGLLKDVVQEGKETWVTVPALAEALGATAQFDPKKMLVELKLFVNTNTVPEPAARVGSLVPNFRLTRLDGSPVSLADFGGRRVLINSWGSW